ncbi:protein transport protein Sec31B-like [Culex quinquefasciatus]|uniref:protein transport protein Sec31B-like n=1 Tax=Culex quinquefasciatus TaxID=7176 RepID=UPI0018E32D9F|nr:protein transport protein Sec31B-like [Culex quinquefasciatus]
MDPSSLPSTLKLANLDIPGIHTQSRQLPGRHLHFQPVNTNRWVTLNNRLHPDHPFPLGATPANQNFRDDPPTTTQRDLDSDHLLDVITEKTASTQLPYRGALWPEANFACNKFNTKIIQSELRSEASGKSDECALVPQGRVEPLDFGTATNPNGVIVGGCEGGVIQVYSALKLLGGENALRAQQDKHNGAVRSMDYNPYQNKLLASGASESESFIWVLNITAAPMSPGAKAQPFEDVQGLALYNRGSPQE